MYLSTVSWNLPLHINNHHSKIGKKGDVSTSLKSHLWLISKAESVRSLIVPIYTVKTCIIACNRGVSTYQNFLVIQQDLCISVEFKIQFGGVKLTLVTSKPLEEPFKSLRIRHRLSQRVHGNRSTKFQVPNVHDTTRQIIFELEKINTILVEVEFETTFFWAGWDWRAVVCTSFSRIKGQLSVEVDFCVEIDHEARRSNSEGNKFLPGHGKVFNSLTKKTLLVNSNYPLRSEKCDVAMAFHYHMCDGKTKKCMSVNFHKIMVLQERSTNKKLTLKSHFNVFTSLKNRWVDVKDLINNDSVNWSLIESQPSDETKEATLRIDMTFVPIHVRKRVLVLTQNMIRQYLLNCPQIRSPMSKVLIELV